MRKYIWAIALSLAAGLGLAAAATIQSPASAASHTIVATADSYTRSDAKTSNYGTATDLFTSGSTNLWRHTLVKFHLPAMASGVTITGAALRLYATTASAGAGPDVYTTAPAGWTETGVTWNTAGARGTWLGKKGGYAAQSWVQWDVTKGLSPTGSNLDVAFRMETNEAAVLKFESRENTAGHAPQLVLTTSGPTPTATQSPTATTPSTPSMPPSVDGKQAAATQGWGAVAAGDEFEYTGVPDAAKWNVYNAAGHAGKGLRRPSQVRVDGSKVIISGTADGTTGGMSANFDRRTYGRWETRMKVSDRDPRYHPVLILWPDSGNWPCDGEIDYAEGTKDSTVMNFFHHYSCSNSQTHAQKTIDSTQWHNYAVEWTSKAIVGYLDGVEWFRDSAPSHQPPGPMHQTVQLDWFPDGTSTATKPTTMDVDWVRVYNPGAAGPSSGSSKAPKSAQSDVHIGAVGDMNPVKNVSARSPSGRNGAAIAEALADGSLDAFFGLGDFQYSAARCSDYVHYWNELWGRTKSKLYWVAGPNHDWKPGRNEDLDNFMDGKCAGDPSRSAINVKRGFVQNGEPYSEDFGTWHVAFLSSALWTYDTAAANKVTSWLDHDLATAQAAGKHLAVVYHEPYFTSNTRVHRRDLTQKPWIDVMYKHRVRLTLSGSQHNYERTCPVDNADRCVADGMTAFQVSTGGVTLRPFTSHPSFVAKRFSDTHGWLQLTLKADGSFRWKFHSVGGSSTDSGRRSAN